MSAGSRHAAAVDLHMQAFVWGGGEEGQLGVDDKMKFSWRPHLVCSHPSACCLSGACAWCGLVLGVQAAASRRCSHSGTGLCHTSRVGTATRSLLSMRGHLAGAAGPTVSWGWDWNAFTRLCHSLCSGCAHFVMSPAPLCLCLCLRMCRCVYPCVCTR